MDLSQPAGMWAILAGASLVVKGIMLLLVAMSLTSWSIIFYKIIALNRARVKAASDFESFQTAEDLSMAFQQLGRNPASPVYAVGYQAVNELKKLEKSKLVGKDLGATVLENLDRTLRLACKTKIRELGSSLPFLATCANAAPFIGLFGTVWGIMDSFHAIGQMKTASLATVAPGISEALIATAIGLAVAIPATMAYNMFLGMLTNIEIELANFSDVFLNRVRREASWERSEAPAQPSQVHRAGF